MSTKVMCPCRVTHVNKGRVTHVNKGRIVIHVNKGRDTYVPVKR